MVSSVTFDMNDTLVIPFFVISLEIVLILGIT